MYATQSQPFSFMPVDIGSRAQLNSRLRYWQFENSEYSFTTLFLWQPGCKIAYTFEDDVLFIRFQCKRDYEFLLAPIVPNESYDYKRALGLAMSYFRQRGKPLIIRSVTQKLRSLIEDSMPGVFDFKHEPDTDDYVYSSESLITLKGKKLHSKRNHINNFLADNEYVYEVYDPAKHREECLSMNMEWHDTKDSFTRGIEGDKIAMERILAYSHELNVIGGVIRINGKVEAFTLGEQLNDNMALIHMEKANADIQGLYPFINREFLARNFAHVEFINREEDMGLEGLRKAKLSYYPCRMIEKYTMTLAK